MMPRVTLDHNCIIDLEEHRAAGTHIHQLLDAHRDGKLQVRLVAIGGSERLRDGTYAKNFGEFQAKLKAIGLDGLETLKPMLHYGIGFWDWSLWAGPDLEELEHKIHTVLFPEIEFGWSDFCRRRGLRPEDLMQPGAKVWRNAKCDVQAMWCHIYHGGEFFITSDGNFHKPSKKIALIGLGAGDILRPDEAVARVGV